MVGQVINRSNHKIVAHFEMGSLFVLVSIKTVSNKYRTHTLANTFSFLRRELFYFYFFEMIKQTLPKPPVLISSTGHSLIYSISNQVRSQPLTFPKIDFVHLLHSSQSAILECVNLIDFVSFVLLV